MDQINKAIESGNIGEVDSALIEYIKAHTDAEVINLLHTTDVIMYSSIFDDIVCIEPYSIFNADIIPDIVYDFSHCDIIKTCGYFCEPDNYPQHIDVHAYGISCDSEFYNLLNSIRNS